MQMICDRCHRAGIYWSKLGQCGEHTVCPHCGGTNCQQEEEPEEEQEEASDGK